MSAGSIVCDSEHHWVRPDLDASALKKPLALRAGLWSAAIALQKNASQSRHAPRYPVLRVLLVIGYFALSMLALDAHAHDCLHEDAGQPGHECALTLMAQGQVEVTGDAVMPVRATGYFSSGFEHKIPAASDSSLRLPPSCGPPVA
jgi:hypothetical protein